MKKGGFYTDTPVHDPAIFVDKDGTYFIFGTHMSAAYSKDLRYWNCFAEGVNADNPLFSNLFDREQKAFHFSGKFNGKEYAVWAPDVSYNPIMGKYVMYFSTSGSYVKSSLCMAVADHPRGPYTFVDTILHSGFDQSTLDKTNIKEVLGTDADISRYLKKNGNYNNLSWPNCIDPNVFRDKEGKLYMVYGSWSGGIFLLKIDEATGRLIHPKQDMKNSVDPYFGKKLLGGGHKSIEGPFILYDALSDYYYLFVSFGGLTREGGYQIRLFRSKKPDGPYVDMDGKTFRRVNHHDPYGLKLIGNYIFPSMDCGYKSPGHNSAFIDQDGKIYIVYHQRFDMDTEKHEPRVHQLFRTKNGWLTVSPFATEGEMLCPKNYHEMEICGTYYLIEHGLDISNEVHKPLKVELLPGGRILKYRDQSGPEDLPVLTNAKAEKNPLEEKEYGTYRLEGESKVIYTLGGIVYEGVIVQLNDEAKNPVMCITGTGSNRSAWAVRYL